MGLSRRSRACFAGLSATLAVARTSTGRKLQKNHSEAAEELHQSLNELLWPANCSEARILLVDFDQDNFEGLGSTLGQVAAALAEGFSWRCSRSPLQN